ncbi:hypothetical protein [Acinetobacter ursingii]|uniref:hypothetical protein n=1 Tax=Acinetobacter ursingii TaxID=108980 RepID=UPI0006679E54|nr:hypothetical protein [Acinetobacter ursingii]MCH2003897.1 hypothetical protein [Acinetobacter ursingii]MCU4304793.1 hypothetical protein [Acinetobacter ursingii]MCU4370798.1 hypothetical protein [Acinetobacter ursingii]MCU4380625.1 hypothetical protein [Acinetobacter ursingii]MCU4482571.1 hypothetical protein [Acinetobacter ursingii]
MIDYSPHTKYTAQKIQDKVTRGAYYYTQFEIDTYLKKEVDIAQVIAKLTQRYHLNLTSRQRNYRLKQGFPIADLIVQDVIYTNKWIFTLLITTPTSQQHCKHSLDSEIAVKPQHAYVQDKINELTPTSWNKDVELKDIQFIQDYFKDTEALRSVFQKPYLSLAFGSSDAELVRLSHKKYAPHQKKFFREPRKSYSWTWRFKQDVIVQKKVELTRIINRIVSQPKKDKALNDLRVWQKYMNTYAVFRGNRQQAGRLYTFGKKFYYSRTHQKWDDAQLPQLNLSFIKRYKTYAESYEEYDLRRYVYMTCGEELPRDISKTLNEKEVQDFMGKFL